VELRLRISTTICCTFVTMVFWECGFFNHTIGSARWELTTSMCSPITLGVTLSNRSQTGISERMSDYITGHAHKSVLRRKEPSLRWTLISQRRVSPPSSSPLRLESAIRAAASPTTNNPARRLRGAAHPFSVTQT
jgi:hypothetical protein